MEAVAQRLGPLGTAVPGHRQDFTPRVPSDPIQRQGTLGRMGWKEQPNGDHELTTKNGKVYTVRRLGLGSYELADPYGATDGTFSLGEGKRAAERRAHDNGDFV